MINIFSICLFASIALASRKICHGRWCNDPCADCDDPQIDTQVISPIRIQPESENTILVCTPESFFERIEFDQATETNTTCNGIIVTQGWSFPNFYTGIRNRRKGQIDEISLDAGKWQWINTHNNGNKHRKEEAELVNNECDGDIIKTLSSWMADDPLTGCCGKGVNHVTATSYKLNIWGKCCSECYLVQSSRSWKIPDKTFKIFV